ncbi:hypothetical protein RchiOBHm_Chr1g0325771 [Rosa chinensis]|nr:hypothetical protein RchiOBHm_Chr1g0325771 [Rosa chinensis]
MVILSFCSPFAPQDSQTVNKSPSSCLPCPAMEDFVHLCNHLFRSQFSLLRSIVVWLLLSFYARSFRNRSTGECMAALSVSSPLQTTLGYQSLLAISVGAPVTNLLWRLQSGEEEEALIRAWVLLGCLGF